MIQSDWKVDFDIGVDKTSKTEYEFKAENGWFRASVVAIRMTLGQMLHIKYRNKFGCNSSPTPVDSYLTNQTNIWLKIYIVQEKIKMTDCLH